MILVQKFGGTSLSDEQGRRNVLRHILREKSAGRQLVVVVSAMGRKGEPYATDTLLDWIGSNGGALSDREKDLLLSCGEIISAATLCSLLNEAGSPSVVLTGGQAGIRTDGRFGAARIVHIDPGGRPHRHRRRISRRYGRRRDYHAWPGRERYDGDGARRGASRFRRRHLYGRRRHSDRRSAAGRPCAAA